MYAFGMKRKIHLTILVIVPILLIGCLSHGYWFGSRVDWLNQHIVFPDYYRHMVWKYHTLWPEYYPHLQAGSNAFAFSYYGFMRPDVLLSILLPQVSMATILIVYMVGLIDLGAISCYRWLCDKGYPSNWCFWSAFFYIFSTAVIFQSHRQIMFVNFLPFLFLALHAIDQENWHQLTLWLVLIVFHSYFFSMAAFIVCFLTIRIEKKQWKCTPFLFAIGISAILWLPSLLYIIENKRTGPSPSLIQLFLPDGRMKSLFYDPYGCGLTMMAWIAIITHTKQEKKVYAWIVVVCMLFPLASYILNGFLYARVKILIVFLPWICLLLVDVFEQHIDIWMWPLIVLPIFFQTQPVWLMLDTYFCVCLLKRNKGRWLYLSVPLIAVLCTNTPSTFVSPQTYQKITQNIQVPAGRTAYFSHSYRTVNRIYDLQAPRLSAYSSTYNKLYNHFFYDVLKNPMVAKHRTGMMDAPNRFFEQMMGIQNIVTKGPLPAGYHWIDTQKGHRIGQNKNVLPLAYVTHTTMNQKMYDHLPWIQRLDTLIERPLFSNSQPTPYTSKIQLAATLPNQNMHSKHTTIKTIDIPTIKNKQIVIIDFKVKPKDPTKTTTITINGIKNRLSSIHSPYYNHNTHFVYILSQNHRNGHVSIQLSKGNYQLQDIQIHVRTANFQPQIQKVTSLPLKDHEVYAGHVQLNQKGYLITSLAYQNGYTCRVDGKIVQPKLVNTAFVGIPLSKGTHTIRISYHAPGFHAGLCISSISLLIYILRRKIYALH